MTDWITTTLDEIGEPIIGLTYSPNEVADEGTLVLRSSNIQKGRLTLDDVVRVVTPIPDKLRICASDILICVRNGSRPLIGKSLLLDDRVIGETFGAFMALYRSKLNPYLRYFFQSDSFRRQVHEHLGATINQITNRSLRGFEVTYPIDEREREVIANYLSDAESYVEVLELLIAKKRRIKHGLAQDLIGCHVRLPGYRKQWERVQIQSIAKISKGSQLGRAQMEENAEIPVWNGGVEPSGYTTKPNIARPVVTISEGGNSCGWVGHPSGPFWLGGHCYALDPTSVGHSVEFLYQTLKVHESAIMALRVGSGLPNIQKISLREFELNMPTDFAEAEVIATVLADADAEITALERQLQSLDAVKTGMMQELLTGRIRLLVEETAA